MFEVGQKVVCVDAQNRGIGILWFMPLSEGAIYTIREIVPDSISCQYNVPESGLPLVKLVEVQDRGPSDIGYQWTRFRALPPDETLSEKQIKEVV